MFWRKKNTEESPYATLNQRLFAIIIDMFILIMLWMPIENMLTPLIYRNSLSPTQELAFILQQKSEPYIAANKQIDVGIVLESFQEFTNNRSILSLAFEQFSELFLLITLTFGFWIKKQATPGKMLLSLKIVDNTTMQPPSTLQYIVRICAYAISMLPLGLGVFYIAFNKKKRAWHDIIAGTAVIKVKRKNAK